MPSFVIAEKCDGCKGGDKTACMYICPNDLMVLEPNSMKAYNQEPDQCWECFSCVKICPTQAIKDKIFITPHISCQEILRHHFYEQLRIVTSLTFPHILV